MMKSLYTILILLFFAGCDQVQQKPLTIGHNDWIGYQPLQLAYKQGYFKNDVMPMKVPSNSESMRLFRNRLLDGLALTLDEAISLYDQTHDIAIILFVDFSNGADSLVGSGSLTRLDQIKGKRIGFEHNSVGALMLTKILEKTHLTLQDIVPVQINAHAHIAAFENKRVDAVITYEPMTSKMLKSGGHILFDSSAIPQTIVDVIVVRKSLLEDEDPRIMTLLKGWFAVLPLIQDNTTISSTLEMTAEEYNKIIKNIIFLDKAKNKNLFFDKHSFNAILTQIISSMKSFHLLEQQSSIPSDKIILHDKLQRYYQ